MVLVVVYCDKTKKYGGDPLPSPYFIKHEGSTMSLGGHNTSWEDAFPVTLKSLKAPKSSMGAPQAYDGALAYDGTSSDEQVQPDWDDIKIGQHTEARLASADGDVDMVRSTLDLDESLPPDIVTQPLVPEDTFGQSLSDAVNNAPSSASLETPGFTAREPEREVVRV